MLYFEKAPYKLLKSKFNSYRKPGNTQCYVYSFLCFPQAKRRGKLDNTNKVQQAVDSGVSQGTDLGQVLFSK